MGINNYRLERTLEVTREPFKVDKADRAQKRIACKCSEKSFDLTVCPNFHHKIGARRSHVKENLYSAVNQSVAYQVKTDLKNWLRYKCVMLEV